MITEYDMPGRHAGRVINVGGTTPTPISISPPGTSIIATKADIAAARAATTTYEPRFPNINLAWGGGFGPQQAMDLWGLWLGSAETQQEIALGYGKGALGVTDWLGLTNLLEGGGDIPANGGAALIDTIPPVDFPGSDIPGLPALDVVLPGAGDLLGGLELPDLGGLKNALIIGGLALAAIYIIGRVAGRGGK